MKISLQFWRSKFWILIVWETSDKKLLRTCFLWYTAGKDVWSSEEDKILLSKDKEAISNLAKKRGLQSVLNRINFIEGIN